MPDHLEWLENQARLARQQIEQQTVAMRQIYEADIRTAMSGRDAGEPRAQIGAAQSGRS